MVAPTSPKQIGEIKPQSDPQVIYTVPPPQRCDTTLKALYFYNITLHSSSRQLRECECVIMVKSLRSQIVQVRCENGDGVCGGVRCEQILVVASSLAMANNSPPCGAT
jgi:hypothetical protein